MTYERIITRGFQAISATDTIYMGIGGSAGTLRVAAVTFTADATIAASASNTWTIDLYSVDADGTADATAFASEAIDASTAFTAGVATTIPITSVGTPAEIPAGGSIKAVLTKAASPSALEGSLAVTLIKLPGT